MRRRQQRSQQQQRSVSLEGATAVPSAVAVESDDFTGRRLDTLMHISRGVVEVVEQWNLKLMLQSIFDNRSR
jgi:hypothetical protein